MARVLREHRIIILFYVIFAAVCRMNCVMLSYWYLQTSKIFQMPWMPQRSLISLVCILYVSAIGKLYSYCQIALEIFVFLELRNFTSFLEVLLILTLWITALGLNWNMLITATNSIRYFTSSQPNPVGNLREKIPCQQVSAL